MIKLNLKNTEKFIGQHEWQELSSQAQLAHRILKEHSGASNDFLGWLDLPEDIKSDLPRIKAAAAKIKNQANLLVVAGIGGSYLGAKAVIEALGSGLLDSQVKIVYAGHNLDTDYLNQLFTLLDQYEVAVNVISKSGTTTETAVAFRLLKTYMEKRYGKKEAAARIYATTDKSRGALKQLADAEGYESFVIPDTVGGRFSVLTAVGLLPIAVADIDIDALVEGAESMRADLGNEDLSNQALQYVLARNILYRKNFTTEILACYNSRLHYLIEWWKQLYGESEGKDQKGIFPAGVDFTTDLHSMGQFIQDGNRILFETVISINEANSKLTIPVDADNLDGLNFLAGKDLHYINQQALIGTVLAHVDGGVPNIILEMDKLNAYTLGELLYFFEYACGISGYLNGVNPFNQPGVEAYKKNMFALLGKPGYEELGAKLKKKLNS